MPLSEAPLTRALERALRSRDRDEAWAALEPFRARITSDAEVALTWATLLSASPGRPGARQDAKAIAEAFATDADILAAVAGALLALDERRPMDEPAPVNAPAHDVVALCTRALGIASGGARIALLRARGGAHGRLRRDEPSLADLQDALALDSSSPQTLRDLGVCHMRAGRWEAARGVLEKAREGAPSKALLFDLGTTATALGDAVLAADAWRALGLPVETPEASLPLVPDMRPVMVRVPTRGPGHGVEAWLPDEAIGLERVWVQPLSPCHGVLRSPTFREAVADYGDVVLFAPAPALFAAPAAVPVMPFHGVLMRGDERRFRFLAMQQEAGQVSAIGRALPEGCVLYQHAERVERVCPRCAAGDVLGKHDHEPAEDHRGVIGKLLVEASADLPSVARALERARAETPGVLLAVPGLYEALGDTATAGKNHKAWGAIERGLTISKETSR